jgi:hypothetical protein
MLLEFLELLAAVVTVAVLFTLARASRAALDGGFQPSIHDRVEKVLARYEGRPLPPELLEELRLQVETVVRDALIDRHDSRDITVLLYNDDVLGPVCRLRTEDGRELSTAEFEANFEAR